MTYDKVELRRLRPQLDQVGRSQLVGGEAVGKDVGGDRVGRGRLVQGQSGRVDGIAGEDDVVERCGLLSCEGLTLNGAIRMAVGQDTNCIQGRQNTVSKSPHLPNAHDRFVRAPKQRAVAKASSHLGQNGEICGSLDDIVGVGGMFTETSPKSIIAKGGPMWQRT